MITIVRVHKYRTSDGKLFDTEAEAQLHEKYQQLLKESEMCYGWLWTDNTIPNVTDKDSRLSVLLLEYLELLHEDKCERRTY